MKKRVLIFALLLIVLSSFFAFDNSEIQVNARGTVEELPLPIVMYHSVLKSRKGKYTIHPDELERDIIRYKEMGYTPVTLREVSDWVNRKGKLPPKPMVITFDDGHYNNLYYALPILKKHNAKAVINIVTSFSRHASDTPDDANNPNFSYLTWNNIRELHDSGLVEIGNHTHAMHKFKPRYGIAQVSNETVDEYKSAIQNDLEKANTFLTKNAGVPRPITFAYPFGKYTNEGREVLKELGFEAILTCNEGVSIIRRGDPTSLYTLKRYNRSGNVSHEKFIKKVFKNTDE
jgi:peptidoglycan/xylan/chitin deacetylase (PgdA/CDA1 family)